MVWVADDQQIEKALQRSSQVQAGMRAVAVGLEAEARQLTFGRAVETGALARSWKAVQTGKLSWAVFSPLKTAVFQEGGTGEPGNHPRYGRTRIVRPKRGKVLVFKAPTSWNVPVGSTVFARFVKGWKPQHILRDAGRMVGKRRGVRWVESSHPVNRATETRGY